MSSTMAVPEAAKRGLEERFRGELLHAESAGYDSARAVWNGMIDRKPGVIARCSNAEDVVEAIRVAREHELVVAVRGGGHNAAGLAVCDGGLVVDLSRLDRVKVDPVRRVAVAGGGATWGPFDRATQEHGLATTGGAVSTTGIAGLTLGGGLGWLMRSHGLACDNLIGADVVTADARVVRASPTENQDLFWGLRGGGGNFGVVTSLEYRLHPVGPLVGGMFIHPLPRAREALRFYRDFTRSAPDALTVFAALMHAPDGVAVLAFAVCYVGPIDEGERAIRPLREFGPPVADQVGPIPYTALQSMLDAGFPSGLQVYWRSEFLASLSDELIDALVDAYERVPSPLSALLIEQLGGAVKRVGRDDTAFDHRDSDYNLAIISRWTDPSEAKANIAWTRDVSEATRPFTNGRVYVNYLGVGEESGRVHAAYGPEKYERLTTIKSNYDPTNFFRLNQNVPPRGP